MNAIEISNISAVAFDLDGTLYFGEEAAPGALELTELLRSLGIKVFYFTNNSSKTRRQIYDKLLRLGFSANISEVYNSSYAAALYVKENNLRNVYCLGTKDLAEQLIEEEINVVKFDSELVDAILIGLNHDFNYTILSEAIAVYNKIKCSVIACNVDRTYPIENAVMPGCGPAVSALECAINRKVDFIVGKPNDYMLSLLVKDHNLDKNKILIVGDSYDSDIAMAKLHKCNSILISEKTDFNTTTAKNLYAIIDIFK